MVLRSKIEPHVLSALSDAQDPQVLAHLSCIQRLWDDREFVLAATKPLNRYSIQTGKTFATSPADKEKYKVLRILADDVVVQNLRTNKIQTFNVNTLLKDWSDKGIKEVSLLDDIIQTVKNVLGPVLGTFLTVALIGWLTDKIGK